MSNFHKQPRPNYDNVKEITIKMRMPPTSDWEKNFISGKQLKPANPDMMKKLNKLIKQYGLDEIAEYIEYKQIKHEESVLAREILNNIKDERPIHTFNDYPPDGCGIGIGSSYREL